LNKDKIIETISQNQVILLTAGTGVGKTVLVPRIALHVFNYGEKVLCTIPKRMSTFLTADFVSKCLDSKLGEHVGYYYQGTNQVNKNGIESKLIFTTTGSLISSMTGADPLLSDYKCIIVDEAHERSVQTDQLLLLLKRACIKRPDLKIIIMSATIDLDRFRDYYPASQFQFGEVDGGSELSFPITDFWVDKKPTNWMEKTIEYTMKILKSTPSGDIMIFVKSGGDGNRLCGMLETAMALYRKELTVKLTNMNSKQTSEEIKKAIYAINPICIKLEAKSTKEEQNLAKEEYLYKSLKDSYGNP
jgi:pre-mRNA-splicing factor ATP-dependent RNA helicase DHX15/PRP43